MPAPIRVLLVDDQPLVRKGLQLILGPEDGFDVVGEAADGGAALDAAERAAPDVVLMDVRMKGMDGVEATRSLRARGPTPPVLVLTTFDDDDDEVLSAALRAGAWLDPAVTGRVLATYRSASPPAVQTPGSRCPGSR